MTGQHSPPKYHLILLMLCWPLLMLCWSFWCFIPRGKCSGLWADPETCVHVPQISVNTLFWNLSRIALASPPPELQVFWLWWVLQVTFHVLGVCRSLWNILCLSLGCYVVWMIPLTTSKDFLLPVSFPLMCDSWSERNVHFSRF